MLGNLYGVVRWVSLSLGVQVLVALYILVPRFEKQRLCILLGLAVVKDDIGL